MYKISKMTQYPPPYGLNIKNIICLVVMVIYFLDLETFLPLGGAKIFNLILRANGESGGKILQAVFSTFCWLSNSEKISSISKAVPEL